MITVIHKLGYNVQQISDAVENRTKNTPFHVTLATDVDTTGPDGKQIPDTKEKHGEIVITGVYVD